MASEMRAALYRALSENMRKNDRIVSLDADLGSANGLIPLRREFPDRAFDIGIAEANMACMAAGMAAYGMIPVINSFTAFSSRRICDQVAISICYANQNVKIIGTDAGITAELNGATHMSFEDIGVLRSIPNIVIVEPSDPIELEKMMSAILEWKGPVYMRMRRKWAEEINRDDYNLEIGKARIIKEGGDVSIIASGIMLAEALKAGNILAAKGIDAEIINMHTIKPLDEAAVIKTAIKTGVLVTCENHSIIGGLRSAVAECVTKNKPVKVYSVGIADINGEVGYEGYLKKRFGLTPEKIAETAMIGLREKNGYVSEI
jgi:transketolase